jgi:hypothetical protein
MPATIFSGSKVKTLKGTLSLNGGADIISSTTNPQTSAVSAEPGSLLLNTTSGTIYRKLDAGSTTNWVEVGAGTGGKNYIKNPDFDGGATTSWSMQKVSLSSFIPTGNIGAADAGHTIATSSSSPLEGANSLLIQGASAFTAGNCLVSKEFTIDREDVAKVMGWSFAYEAITTNMDFSGTTANTWAVYIAEVTTGTPDTVVSWIQPAGVYNLVQGSGVGLASGTFQTTATESSAYRIVLVCINSEAAATTLKVDDFQLGPQKVVYGSPVTDWQSVSGMTATSAATVVVTSALYRRVGDSYDYQADLTFSGAGSVNEVTIALPPGVVIDVNKEPSTGIRTACGDGLYRNTGSGALQTGVVYYATGVTGSSSIVFYTPTVTVASGHTIGINFRIPVVGLSSSVSMSNDTDTRVVALEIGSSAAGSTAPTGTLNTSSNIINYSTARTYYDTNAAYSAGSYTVQVTGFYDVSAGYGITHTVAAGFLAVEIWVGSVNRGQTYRYVSGAGDSAISTTKRVFCNAGDVITARSRTNLTTPAYTAAAVNYLSIARTSGPATIAASETVAFAAYGSTSTVANGSLDAMKAITHAVTSIDTHKSYNSSAGTYTIPVSGKYLINGNGAANDTSIQWRFGFSVDDPANYYSLDQTYAETAGTIEPASFSAVASLVAGQVIRFGASHSSVSPVGMLNDGRFNFVSIVRVGN